MIRFYDNGGNTTDQYSMDVRVNNEFDCYSFSSDALSPQGVNSFLGTYLHPKHKGEKEIDFDDLPKEVQDAVVKRLVPDED